MVKSEYSSMWIEDRGGEVMGMENGDRTGKE